MSGIKVQIVPTKSYREYAVKYHNSVKILTISDSAEKKFVHEIAINGTLLLSTDDRFELINIELMAGSSSWKRDLALVFPKPKIFGRLFIPEITALEKATFAKKVFAYNNRNEGILQISFEENCKFDTAAQFSHNCITLLRKDELAGILVQEKSLKY